MRFQFAKERPAGWIHILILQKVTQDGALVTTITLLDRLWTSHLCTLKMLSDWRNFPHIGPLSEKNITRLLALLFFFKSL